MNIPRPDSFAPVISNGTYIGRECHLGKWADHYRVHLGGEFGDFDAWFNIDTVYPLEFRGITIPTITAAYHHTNMVPIFNWHVPQLPNPNITTSTPSDPAKKFFPETLSWAALDDIFTTFENKKGNCLPVDLLQKEMMSTSFVNLLDSYQQVLDDKSMFEWIKFEILRGLV